MNARKFIEDAVNEQGTSINFEALYSSIKEAEQNEPEEAHKAHLRTIFDDVVKRANAKAESDRAMHDAVAERIKQNKAQAEQANRFVFRDGDSKYKVPTINNNKVIQG